MGEWRPGSYGRVDEINRDRNAVAWTVLIAAGVFFMSGFALGFLCGH